VYLATWRGRLFALDAATGAPRWQRTLGQGRPGEGSEAAPALSGSLLVAGSYQGTLYALDAHSGTDRWQFQAGGPLVSPAALSDDTAYCASEDGALYAVDATGGRLRWRLALGEMRGAPALVDSLLTIGTLGGDLVGVR